VTATIAAAVCACGPRGPGATASDAGKFRFRADRVPVRTAFHYVKSNIDGTQPIRVTVYVADTSHLEVVKLEPQHRDGVLVKAHVDWTTFSADTIQTVGLLPGGERAPGVTAWLTGNGAFVVRRGDRSDTVPITRLPVHVYDFDFVADGPQLLSFDGTATIRYEGEVPCHAAICRRYKVSGPGLRGAQGAIWVDRVQGHVERIEIPVPDNPAWRDFKLELQRTQPMDRAAWERWLADAVRGL